MLQLKGRKIDDYGQVILEESGLCDILMRGDSISGLCAEDTENIRKFNDICRQFDHTEEMIAFCRQPNMSKEDFDLEKQSKWFIPEPYNTIDVFDWLLNKCKTDEEQIRVCDEWILERKILWGIGRGSSVSSYCLYLIGIHRVNSLKYNLDYREFLK